MVDHGNPVGTSHRAEPVRHHDHRSSFHQPLERTTGVTLDADYRFGALETQLRYGFAARRDGVDRDAQRVWLRLTRRF